MEELKELWRGLVLEVRLPSLPLISVRGALVCSLWHGSFTRKLGVQLIGHLGTLGCSKCLEQFQSSGLHQLNYGGFEPWKMRCVHQYRHVCESYMYMAAETRAMQESTWVWHTCILSYYLPGYWQTEAALIAEIPKDLSEFETFVNRDQIPCSHFGCCEKRTIVKASLLLHTMSCTLWSNSFCNANWNCCWISIWGIRSKGTISFTLVLSFSSLL